MMRSGLCRIGILAAIYVLVSPVFAHHSASMFDLERSLTLDGVVTRYDWVNPHVYIEVEMAEAGERASWIIEGAPPSVMSRLGWSRSSLASGERVVVTGHPARDASRRMILGNDFIRVDGSVLAIRGDSAGRVVSSLELMSAAEAPRSAARSLAGNWLTPWDPDVALRFLQPQRFWPLTERGIASTDAYDESVNPYRECNSEPVPYLMIWPIVKRIEIGDTVVVMRFENEVERTVHLDISTHEGAPYSDHGHSIGWWEGDALVVDTTHFADHRRGNALGLASGPRKHLAERFELKPDRTALSYTYELEDPDFLAEPVSGVIEMTYRPDIAFEVVPCDPRAARRYLD